VEDRGRPLKTALAFNAREAAEVLVDHGARVDNLVLAAGMGRLDLVRSYFDEREQISADTPPIDDELGPMMGVAHSVLDWALQYAVLHRRLDVARFLVDRGADVNAPIQRAPLLNWTAYYGLEDAVAFLLDHGARLVRDSMYGASPIGWAKHGGHPKIVSLLLDRKCVDLVDAIDCGQYDRTKAFLDVAPDLVDGLRGTGIPIRAAAAAAAGNLVQLLIDRGANVNLPNADGKTALGATAARPTYGRVSLAT
jgi:hypothetical protein